MEKTAASREGRIINLYMSNWQDIFLLALYVELAIMGLDCETEAARITADQQMVTTTINGKEHEYPEYFAYCVEVK